MLLTRGSEGATVFARGGSVSRPAITVKVADTVGAGDATMGGLLAALRDRGCAVARTPRATRRARARRHPRLCACGGGGHLQPRRRGPADTGRAGCVAAIANGTPAGVPTVTAAVRDLLELGGQLGADRGEHTNDDHRDQRGNQAVFDGRRAALVPNRNFEKSSASNPPYQKSTVAGTGDGR